MGVNFDTPDRGEIGGFLNARRIQIVLKRTLRPSPRTEIEEAGIADDLSMPLAKGLVNFAGIGPWLPLYRMARFSTATVLRMKIRSWWLRRP